MNPFRARGARSITAVSLGLIAMVAAERPLGARQAEPLLQPTPLVLKDGRIANVSIHVVPFAPGRAQLSGEAEARVADLTRAVGTDCFLTAQVIGHIDSSEVGQDDTLNAHRLARSRADAVQASLIGGGLPAKAIASVWDWQFLVRAPRATLWVFQLTAGEDCEGRPLQGDMIARAAPSSPQASQPERATPAPAERTASTAAQAPVTARVDETARPSQPAASRPNAEPPQARADAPRFAQPLPAAERERTAPARPAEERDANRTVATRPALAPRALTSDRQIEQPARQGEAGTAVAARPAPATKAPASDGQVEQPAIQREVGTAVAAKPAAPTKPPTSDGQVERGPEGTLVITFATNSSYFPSGAARRLRELIAGIDAQNKYEVVLQVAVSGSTKVVGARSPQEAARYNKWLAERRLERVQDWLLKNTAADALSFKPEYVTDESRQVVVRLAPVG